MVAIIHAMTVDWNGTEVAFRCAVSEHVDDVLSVLDEAAGWLDARGVSQWPLRFKAAWVEEAISRGETWLAEAGGKVAGTATVDWSDPLWADVARHRGDVAVGGAPGQRQDDGPITWVSRYELPLARVFEAPSSGMVERARRETPASASRATRRS
ncbi:hypothetical protein AB0B45_23525 [Nonomuraea sp. NPDC049152]|uniref:hypothetical protein n=1 Tax=Nonomuraea sp. NPDC049152 TaxID=3154350 RepID=UPI0033F7485E